MLIAKHYTMVSSRQKVNIWRNMSGQAKNTYVTHVAIIIQLLYWTVL